MRGLVTAIRTLTIVPVPGKEAERAASALPWFPLVGALLGALLWALPAGWAALFRAIAWPGGMALVMLALWTVLTGGLHLDGLADWADGFFGSRDREKTLAIMKDSRVGAFGAIALVVVLLAKWAALSRLVEGGGEWALARWLIAVLASSRAVQVDLAASLPYARPEGGTAGRFTEGAGLRHRVAALAVALVLSVLACGPLGAAATVAAWLLGRAFAWYCRRRVGGITGDLLGAATEIVEVVLLMAIAAAANPLTAFSGWRFLLD
ncbi:MAG: adenosylcobinamide-GDP ribazoletransferase [Planctomycetota bacterium]|jgi:adenosylcobinamide-GDP ribazoletransferase